MAGLRVGVPVVLGVGVPARLVLDDHVDPGLVQLARLVAVLLQDLDRFLDPGLDVAGGHRGRRTAARAAGVARAAGATAGVARAARAPPAAPPARGGRAGPVPPPR